MHRTLYLAPIVYNGMGTPRREGGIVVQEALGESRVVAVGPREELITSFPDADRVELDCPLSPPPVNAHTHLDLTSMEYSPGGYEEFIAAVIAHSRSGRRSVEAARAGVEELLRDGHTVVGDIVTDESVMHFLLAHERLRGVAYWEVLGPDPADAPRLLEETERLLRSFCALERPGGMRVGVSPHTPHTVSAPLLRGLADLARRLRLPMQIHVAESAAELELHREGGGGLARALAPYLPNWRPSGRSPVGYLESLGVLAAAPTLVHMVHVDDDDIRLVARNGCTVVHCPRSNVALSCGRFPWERFARLGVTVALGSDSRGSSPTLSVEEETAFARELHGEAAAPVALVRSAVKGGYRALGLVPPRFARGSEAQSVHRWRVSL